MKTRFFKFPVILTILLLGLLYHYKYLNEFPSHIHAWAQSDRYALSLGFNDNGLNFFKPQTYICNHQFPHKWKIPSEKSITAVDFPIHDYIPALLMKLTNNTSPWLFRLYILLYSMVGLFYLFRLAYTLTTDYFKSIFVIIFAATSPVYVYYQNGFLPTIPSLANTIIGLYLYYRHIKENKQRDFVYSIFFFTLAALARTTFAIPLIAVLSIEFIRLVKKETGLIPKLIPASVSMLLLIIYQLYNEFLREQYGSIFLNHTMLPDNMAEVIDILKMVYNNWRFQYFTKIHYIIVAVSVLVAFIFSIKRKTSIVRPSFYFGLLIPIYFMGCLIFALLMLRQFPAHDYYFLDTFYIPVILLFIFSLSYLPPIGRRYLKIAFITILCSLSVGLILQPIKSQEQRRETGFWDKTESTIQNYTGASKFLDSIGVPKNSKILVLDAVSPNIPFILMQRKGFAVMKTNRENIEDALKWDFDYIVFQDNYFISDIYTPFPEILSRLDKMADNGKITACKLTKTINPQSLLGFMGITGQKPVFEKSVTFEDKPDSLWQNTNSSDNVSYTGKYSGYLSPDILYGLTLKTKDLPELTTASRKLVFSSYFLRNAVSDCELVTSINSDGKNIYYISYNLKDLLKGQNSWENVSLLFQLPKIQSNDYELALFIWNTGKGELYYDDFSIAVY